MIDFKGYVLVVLVCGMTLYYVAEMVKPVLANDPLTNCLMDNSLVIHGPMTMELSTPGDENATMTMGKNVGLVFGDGGKIYAYPSWKDFAVSLRDKPKYTLNGGNIITPSLSIHP